MGELSIQGTKDEGEKRKYEALGISVNLETFSAFCAGYCSQQLAHE